MKFLFFLSLSFIIFSCSTTHEDPRLKDKDVPMDFDLGVAENGIYTNKYFGMTFSYNKNWNVQSHEELNRLVDLGAEVATGDDELLKASVEASKVNTAYLFSVFRDELGSSVEFNPSVMSIAENVSKYKSFKTGKDYLKQARTMIERSQLQTEMVGDFEKVNLGTKPFYSMTLKGEQMGVTYTQEYFATIEKGFSLSFIVTYQTDEDRAQMIEVLESIEFKK